MIIIYNVFELLDYRRGRGIDCFFNIFMFKLSHFFKLTALAIIVTFLYTLIRFKLAYPSIPFFHTGGNGLFFYYQFMNLDDNVLWFAFMFFISGELIGSQILKNKKSGLEKMIVARIGLSHYLSQTFWRNFWESGFLYLCCEMSCFLTVDLICDSVYFSQSIPALNQFTHINSNPFWNLILSIFFSAIGYQIFSSLVLGLSLWIKNLNIYRASGIILGMLLLFIPIIGVFFPQGSFIEILFSFLYLPNIMSFGISNFGRYSLPYSCWIMYGVTSFLYVLITFLIFKIGIYYDKKFE